ncbi:MAG: hypothetical protein M3P51_05715, partial [Chloroflexota bacterium]|nr:hypothetical protein [Chloroflexota bacterium]
MADSQSIRVMSSVPGRTRLKVSSRHRTQQEMQRIADALGARPDVSDVRANIHTGSLLVHHDQGQGGLAGLRTTLEEMGFTLLEITQGEAPVSNGERQEAAANLLGAVNGLNERVAQITRGKFDLRLLVPLSLGALSARQVARKGLELDEIPWYVLAWDAFQSFSTLHS